MNSRLFLSINLLAIALLLVILPKRDYHKNHPKPGQQIKALCHEDFGISVDQAARYLNNNDSTVRFIDLRSPDEFKTSNIPGSINIPYDQLMDKNVQGYLNPDDKMNILYSNGDLISNLSLTLLNGLGYKNNTVLTGGMNEWFKVVMHMKFKGGRLSARENALLENRYKAKNLFTEINSLPDSLKNTVLEAKVLEEVQLDGGCE